MGNETFILVDTGSESNKVMMGDVGRMHNGIQLSDVYEINSFLLRKIHQAHFSYKLSTKFSLPLKGIWNKYCTLDKLVLDKTMEYYLVFINNAIHKIDLNHLNNIANRGNVHLVILLLDAYKDFPELVKQQMKRICFEQIYSFQKNDCKRYGFKYVNTIYSCSMMQAKEEQKIVSNLYFVGADKGRIEQINLLNKKASLSGLKCDFTVVVDKKKEKLYARQYPGIKITSKRLSYSKILEGIFKTECILEFCQKDQDGLTMRFYEAMFYNKLLLTNNQTALNHPMYNKKYMRILSDENNVDIDFLRDVNAVDYKYNNEMSPVHFMKRLVDEAQHDRD